MLDFLMDMLSTFIDAIVQMVMSFLVIPFEIFSDMLNTLFN